MKVDLSLWRLPAAIGLILLAAVAAYGGDGGGPITRKAEVPQSQEELLALDKSQESSPEESRIPLSSLPTVPRLDQDGGRISYEPTVGFFTLYRVGCLRPLSFYKCDLRY